MTELEVARITDPTSCPTHGKSLLSIGGSPTVQAGGLPVARIGDACICGGAIGIILRGNPTVLVKSSPVARWTDSISHSAFIDGGCEKVLVGAPATDSDGNLLVLPPECAYLSRTINDADKAWNKDPAKDDRPQKKLERWRRPYTLSSPKPITYTDRNTKREVQGVSQTAEINGKKVEVITPDAGSTPPAGKSTPSAAQIAKSLSVLPDETLDSVDTVVVTNTPNEGFPADQAGGTIYQYPVGGQENLPITDQPNQDWRMLHEGAHAYDHEKMGLLREAQWKEAMDRDARHPTAYARNKGLVEDYPESVVMYALVRGTPCEAYARKMFPARFAVLDAWHGERYR